MSKYETQLLEHLNKLKKKTIHISKMDSDKDAQIHQIKLELESAPEPIKGKLFEKYITYLYRGNQILAKHCGRPGDGGADVLILNPEVVSKVETIVQTKNKKTPLTLKEARSEIVQFETEAAVKHHCYHYILISINGFVKDCDKLRQTNMKMVDWNYVVDLILGFSEEKLNAKCRLPRLELRAHNQVAYEEMQKFLKNNEKLAVVRATGTGKSFLIVELLKDYVGKNKIVVAPSHYILDDLKKKFFIESENVSYLTYQKINAMKKEELKALKADLIIFDEFHRLGASQWGESCNQIIRNNLGTKIVGFSATPIRFLDNSRNMIEEYFENKQIEELDLGTAILRRILPTPTYISSIYTVEEEISNYEGRIEGSQLSNNEKIEISGELNNIKVEWESVYGIDKILEKHLPDTKDNLKFIVFCENIDHLNRVDVEVEKWFKKAVNKEGSKKYKDIRPYRIHSKTTRQKQVLQKFAENKEPYTIDLLFSVNMFNEGVHIEGITGVILLRETASPNIYYQQIGRTLAVGNENPLIFDFVNNFKNLKANECDFEKTINNAKKRFIQDREELKLPLETPNVLIVDYLEDCEKLFKNIDQKLRRGWNFRYLQLEKYIEQHHTSIIPKQDLEYTDLRLWANNQRKLFSKGELPVERVILLNQLNFDWTPEETEWHKMYRELEDCVSENGLLEVLNDSDKNGRLIKWVKKQCIHYKDGKLSSEKIALLQTLGVDLDPLDPKWIKKCQQADQYINKSRRFNYSMNNWLEEQKDAYKKGLLNGRQIKMLYDIGFDVHPEETKWNNHYQILKNLFDTNGYLDINEQVRERELQYRLNSWATGQRRRYRNGTLPKQKIDLLNQIDFDWDPLGRYYWDENYERLKNFFICYGHSNIPENNEELSDLAQWYRIQKRYVEKGKLSKKKTKLLEEIDCSSKKAIEETPHVITTQNVIKFKVWFFMYKELITFHFDNGHSNVPSNTKNRKLRKWVEEQRINFEKGLLTEKQIELLNQLNFDFNPEETYWMKKYEQLKEFIQKNGHMDLPKNSKEYAPLLIWVRKQRQLLKRARLKDERIELLNQINFDWGR